MNRLYASLIVATLLFIPSFWKSEGAKPEVQPQSPTLNSQHEKTARKKNAFRKGNELLTRKGVPFDPDELLEAGWQRRLKRTLDQMPELQVVQQGDNKLKGAQLAHTLYLPDNIQLTGDTVILARRLVFIGRNVVIKGNFDIHIFTIDETQLVDNSSIRKNGASFVKVSSLPASTLASLKPVQGLITIDTSGAGREQWLENQRRRQLAQQGRRSKQAHHALAAFQNADGANGSDGQTGTNGNPGQSGNNGSAGPNGSCTGDINGGDATPGGDGTGGGNGGNGGGGTDGQDGGNVSFTAQFGQSYVVSANGGSGGNGGPGGFGGQGGNGATGGRGGDGAACSPCSIGSPNTSNGGAGGAGGFGGDGGDGGMGGTGGTGGDGGVITIQYPTNYPTMNISASANGGSAGGGGAGGFGGQGGSAGTPGQGGSGNRGFACSGSGNQGGNGFTPNGGASGDSNSAGQPGGNGAQGEISITEQTGGGGFECQTREDCSCECFCFDGMCSFATPILIDVAGNGFDLTSGVNGVRFDLNADGRARGLAWTATSSDDAWLALDRNGNGLIDDGTELFGDVTQQPSSEFPNGFTALGVFDKPESGGNGDGKITTHDTVFSSLRLWRDSNHNGISETSELHSLESLGVITLHLEFKKSRRIDRFGNEFRYRGKVTDRQDAQLGRWAWDVLLVSPFQQ